MSGFFNADSWRSKETRTPSIAHCGKCGLHKKCYTPKMQPTGTGKYKVLFIGSAPDREEDRQGKHLVGESGMLLVKMVRGAKVKINECWKTNAVICNPSGPPTLEHVTCCTPNLLGTIRELQPKVIIPLGKDATDSILGPLWHDNMKGIARWAGFQLPIAQFGAWVCPTYDPLDILKAKDDELILGITKRHIADAMMMKRETIETPTLDELKSRVDILKDDRSIKRRLRALANKKGQLAFDYETTGLKPEYYKQRIVSCSFCHEGEDTFAFMVKNDFEYHISKVLQNPDLQKIASNMKFEERWTVEKLGYPVANWHWDTMLAAHVLDNRTGVTSVKFQTFVMLGIGNYSSHIEPYLKSKTANGLNHIYELTVDELLMYNGIDSLVEFLVAQKQKEMIC